MNRHKEVDRNKYSDHPVAQRWLVDSNFASNTILRANHPTAQKSTLKSAQQGNVIEERLSNHGKAEDI